MEEKVADGLLSVIPSSPNGKNSGKRQSMRSNCLWTVRMATSRSCFCERVGN